MASAFCVATGSWLLEVAGPQVQRKNRRSRVSTKVKDFVSNAFIGVILAVAL